MCGIAGMVLNEPLDPSVMERRLKTMNRLQAHRGPDGNGTFVHESGRVGLGHVRLSIIDLSTGGQPMTLPDGTTISYNGEIYNYLELKRELGEENFSTTSDTEVILQAYRKWGEACVSRLRGMFAFAIWDPAQNRLFCARDRFGIKPFYYTETPRGFFFASEIKALLPFVNEIATDMAGLKDYLAFQFTLGDKTLFSCVKALAPAHTLSVKPGYCASTVKYWEVVYELDWDHTRRYFSEKVRELLLDSVAMHLRSDVPVGAYLSGGLDSGIISCLARQVKKDGVFPAFHGKFSGPDYDESIHARAVSDHAGLTLFEREFIGADFPANIKRVIYHLDHPVAGPGSFPQFLTSKLASEHLKVVLGGQGGDEIFGGYARYLISYFEQCIKGAIDGTMKSGNFVVTYESIIPNLESLRAYKPLLQEFWSEGLFDDRDKRYFRLINRANGMADEINWQALEPYSALETFREIFWGPNVPKSSYFDSMTHFDFKTLLPALLQVEDRMSMAHGLESRVPILDHPLVEFAATIPADSKFQGGELKHLLKTAFASDLPSSVLNRKDKMGFPVPLSQWMRGELRDFVEDAFHGQNARHRDYLNPSFNIAGLLSKEGKFTRKVWGLLCLELWQQLFHDKSGEYKSMAEEE